MCSISSVKRATGDYQVTGCTIGGLGVKVQYAAPCTTPTCIVIMTNATSNVAVGFPAIPRLPVTIVTMSMGAEVCMGKPKARQRLGYLPGHYHQ
jgi:hypothetical protein